MSKGPATFADMRSTVWDYEWKEVGVERGGPIPGIKEKLLAWDPENGTYSRIVLFEPGFKFSKALKHPFWEELIVLDGHVYDYGSNRLCTKGFYALRPAGVEHGPFGTDLGATVLEITWHDESYYTKKKKDVLGKGPATFADMRSTIFDYAWDEVGKERGGPIPGIKEKLLASDPLTGTYSRLVIFEPGFKFSRALNHPFWEELFLMEGHMVDHGTNTLYTKGGYALRPAGIDHGPFGTEIGCTLLEITWQDGTYYKTKLS